ncbi:MAG: hypothetical protein HYW26_02425 [Candidatus Aenigmarchaeota archaeon]|nr:hypothetical protein [Candidatus Aenigmarchaeota archaeon]
MTTYHGATNNGNGYRHNGGNEIKPPKFLESYNLRVGSGRPKSTAVEIKSPYANSYQVKGGKIRFYSVPEGQSTPKDFERVPTGTRVLFVHAIRKNEGLDWRVTTYPVNAELLKVYGLNLAINATMQGLEGEDVDPRIHRKHLTWITRHHEQWMQERTAALR